MKLHWTTRFYIAVFNEPPHNQTYAQKRMFPVLIGVVPDWR